MSFHGAGKREAQRTLNRLALVPMMKPAWSNPLTHAEPLSAWPFVKCVPAYVRFIPAERFGSYDAISNGEIYRAQVYTLDIPGRVSDCRTS